MIDAAKVPFGLPFAILKAVKTSQRHVEHVTLAGRTVAFRQRQNRQGKYTSHTQFVVQCDSCDEIVCDSTDEVIAHAEQYLNAQH